MSRALVVRLDSMGDVLLAGPAVRAVARSHEVVLLCSAQGAAAARLLPGVSEVLVWNCPWIVSPPPPVEQADLDALVGDIRAGGFAEAVILTSFHQSPLPLALLLRLAGVPKIVGASVDYGGALLDVRLRPGEGLDEDIPEPERALAIAHAAGHRLAPDDPGLLGLIDVPKPSWAQTAPYVVVHPGAAVPARTWPAERHAELVRLLAAIGLVPVVTGGPDEVALTSAIAGTEGVDLGGRLTLPELAGVLAGAEAVVVGNTGPAHLAAAVGTSVVSLFSPVVPAVRWRPYGVPHVLLGDQSAACRGTRARLCPVTGHPCLSSIDAADVLSALTHLLAAQASSLVGAR